MLHLEVSRLKIVTHEPHPDEKFCVDLNGLRDVWLEVTRPKHMHHRRHGI